ncbi:hypothetical protein GUJ93_ZPchr0012g21410 [Zizania palustris]|uniref:Uncharacterized protein n=1 Tax=Zizania palustris TaxID=103762 RepID=A0A8J5WVB7_ZIZPA|nr:hypothetical protein GUJ93_ZPchr0012g21410 [Zizania palustris]
MQIVAGASRNPRALFSDLLILTTLVSGGHLPRIPTLASILVVIRLIIGQLRVIIGRLRVDEVMGHIPLLLLNPMMDLFFFTCSSGNSSASCDDTSLDTEMCPIVPGKRCEPSMRRVMIIIDSSGESDDGDNRQRYQAPTSGSSTKRQ